MKVTTQVGKRHWFRAAVPRLPVADVTATFEFYVGKLGFRPLYRFGTEAGVGLGDVILRFCEGEPVRSESLTIYIEITGTDELFERYVAEGVDVRFEPEDMPWGSRDFGIHDSNGYRLTFGDFRDDTNRRTPTPTMAAVIETMMAGDLDQIRRLLDDDPTLVSSRAPAGYRDDRDGTLLHFLMDFPAGNHPANVVDMAGLLIESGADVESRDGGSEGSTPLQLLVGIETPTPHEAELTGLLLGAGATTTGSNADQSGMDAFSVALLHGHTRCAALMYEAGYPPNFAWAGAGLGNMNLVRSFFGEGDGAELPADQRADSLGEEAQPGMNCAFLVAAINGQTEVLAYLLDKGMDIDMQPPASDFAGIGATALHWAVRNGRREAVELLVARGANLLVRDDIFQLTPAGWAGWYGHGDIRKFLLDARADNDGRRDDGDFRTHR